MTTSPDPTARSIADALARLRRRERGGGPGHHGPRRPPVGDEHEHEHGGEARGGRRGHGRPSRDDVARSRGRARCLDVLERSETPLTVGRIAEELGVDQPRASKLVQAVVDAGLARRERDPEDARRTLISLTESGRDEAQRMTRARTEAVETALADFDAAEREQLAALLTRFAEAWPQRDGGRRG